MIVGSGSDSGRRIARSTRILARAPHARDAQGLSEKDAPAGLLVTNDVKRSRWVRGIDAIFVLDARKNLPK